MPISETDGVGPGDLARFMRRVNEDRGLDLSQYRQSYLERRLASRLRGLDLVTYRQYSRYLEQHPDEYTKLIDTLTINVTDFYRDPDVYKVFEGQVLPALIDAKLKRRQRMIRAWSAGCSTGEEPYSIAMSCLASLGARRKDFLVSVLGTDIDPAALEVAKRAEYSSDNLTRIPLAYQREFLDLGRETFRVKPFVMDAVRFRVLNLFEDKPINVVDIIFCRNVFIYFTRDQQARVMERFWSALVRGGYLVLGRSEKLAPAVADRLELVDARQRVYRKPR